MSVDITGTYEGQLKVKLTHGPSGTEILTAAPVDNNGDGSSFSPTDLVAAALGACMVTIMGIQAERHGIDLSGCRFSLQKEMASNPRRLGHIPITIHMPANLAPDDRIRLERGAHTCPVGRSLLPGIEGEVRFVYPD